MSDHAVGRHHHVEQPAGTDGGRHRPARLTDVDHPAAGQVALERPRSFQFDFGPA